MFTRGFGAGVLVLRTFCNHEIILTFIDHSFFHWNFVFFICRGFCVGCLMLRVVELSSDALFNLQNSNSLFSLCVCFPLFMTGDGISLSFTSKILQYVPIFYNICNDILYES